MEDWVFRQKLSLPYEAKLVHAELRAREFYEKMDGNVFCSVGGLDSLTLLEFLRQRIDKNIEGVSVSCIEDKSIQDIHSKLDNFKILLPKKSKVEIIKKHGFPIISKLCAGKIETIQNPTEKNITYRKAIFTGITSNGNFSPRTKLPDKWLKLFGGNENNTYGTDYKQSNFKVSNKCCKYMKEDPCNEYAKSTGKSPYMGLMYLEGGQRAPALIKNGCNYYGKISRSCPFAIFTKAEILRLAIELKIKIPAAYGEIIKDGNGELCTSKTQRTGCSICGFGIQLEERPHRFDRLRKDNYLEWRFWMYEIGFGEVLSYIGVEWEDDVNV